MINATPHPGIDAPNTGTQITGTPITGTMSRSAL
jgi:hypothetical protein